MASGLLTFDADLNAIPDWAETFTPNEDASVWTFNIRPDNQGWTNGTDTRPVTAQDFVFSWERQLNPANAAAYAGFLFDIKNAEKYNLGEEDVAPEDLGVKALDDWTLEVTMEGPRAYFPQVVGYQAVSPGTAMGGRGARCRRLGLGDRPVLGQRSVQARSVGARRHRRDVTEPGHWNSENLNVKKAYLPIIPAGCVRLDI